MEASRGNRSKQPGIRSRLKHPPDIDKGLFDLFFRHPAFKAWIEGDGEWELHISGRPGCGKTTICPFIADYISQKTPYDVATVFVEPFQHSNGGGDVVCVDDILDAILNQLRPEAPSTSGRFGSCLMTGAGVITPGLSRVPSESVEIALSTRIAQSQRTFIIIDSFDNLQTSLQSNLQQILKSLQPRPKILLTKRVPIFEDPIGYFCNNCGRELHNLFWRCSACEEENGFDVCYNCKKEVRCCDTSGHEKALIEPYDHIDVDIGTKDEKALERFAKRDLERELQPSVQRSAWTAQAKAQSVIQRSGNDLAITKLRLDQIRETGLFHDVEKVRDRLPRGVVALYDFELDHIEATSRKEKEIVLVTFRIVTKGSHAHIEELEEILGYISGTGVQSEGCYPHVANMLRLARGLIVQHVEHWTIYFCHQDFVRYVQEGYNRDIVECKSMWEKYQQWERLHEEATAIDSQEDIPLSSDLDGLVMSESKESEENEHNLSPTAPPSLVIPRPVAIPSPEAIHVLELSPLTPLSPSPKPFPQTKATPLSKLSRLASSDSTDSGYFSSPTSPGEERLGTDLEADTTRKTPETEIRPKLCSKEPLLYSHSLCSFCKETVFQGKTVRGYHYRSVIQLEYAANRGCPFCSHIYAHTKECRTGYYEHHDCSRRYWTLRTTGKTSNSYDICAVTFQEPCTNSQCIDMPRAPLKRFLLVNEADLSHVPTADMLGQSTQLRDAGKQILSWINDCNQNHRGCEYRSKDEFVPTRLVDIETGSSGIVKVVQTKTHGIRRPYVTLSHCWGKHIFLTLRRVNEKSLMMEGVHVSKLTRNFQEAIEVARFIGMRYIWIDSLCIVQGEDGDFLSEGQYMHKVYRFSYCNIVAADSPDSTRGIFRSRNAASVLPATYSAGDESLLENGSWRILEEDMWQTELLETPIYTRGWVFQERMLSPRILHFTKSQIYWDCSTLSACETLPTGMPLNLDRFAATDRHWRGRLQETSEIPHAELSGVNDDSMETFWEASVLKYTECDLTNQEDKAVAVWSIAKLVRDQLAQKLLHERDGEFDEYGAGLWSVALHEQMAWHARDIIKGARLEDLQVGNPSWSWTSVKGAILTQSRLFMDRCYAVKSHDGDDIKFRIENPGGSRNEMPVLKEPFSIDMNGYLREEILVENTEQLGTFRLHVSSHIDEVFQVYLDEKMSITPEFPLRCHFAILAASKENDLTQGTRYNGTGIIVEPHEAFATRTRVVFKNVLRQFFKTSFDANVSRWTREVSIKRIAGLRKILRREQLHEAGPHFRRMGAVHFRNVGAETWSMIEKQGCTRFWLD